MTTAAVISFGEAPDQALAKTRARRQLHEPLEQWLDRLEAHGLNDSFSLEELPQAVFGLRQELTGKIIEALVE